MSRRWNFMAYGINAILIISDHLKPYISMHTKAYKSNSETAS